MVFSVPAVRYPIETCSICAYRVHEMPWTQTDIDALKTAIAGGRGVKSVTFGDQTVTFNSPKEMLDLLAVMQQDVQLTAGTRQGYRVAVTSKGL